MYGLDDPRGDFRRDQKPVRQDPDGSGDYYEGLGGARRPEEVTEEAFCAP